MGCAEVVQVDVSSSCNVQRYCRVSLSYYAYIRLLVSTMRESERDQLTAVCKQEGAFMPLPDFEVSF